LYRGKHTRRGKHLRRSPGKRKAAVLLSMLALVLLAAAGVTLAYLTAGTGPLKNTFTPTSIGSDIDETFSNDVKTNVTVTNTGDSEAYIRAAIVITWKDAKDGNVYAGAPKLEQDYNLTIGNGWILGNDGFYYHKTPVAAKASTSVLIVSCTPVVDTVPEGYGLNVEILGSAIQSVPTSVVTEKWGVTLDDAGNITGTKAQ